MITFVADVTVAAVVGVVADAVCVVVFAFELQVLLLLLLMLLMFLLKLLLLLSLMLLSLVFPAVAAVNELLCHITALLLCYVISNDQSEDEHKDQQQSINIQCNYTRCAKELSRLDQNTNVRVIKICIKRALIASMKLQLGCYSSKLIGRRF